MEGRKEFWVRLPNGTRWSPERQQEQPEEWQAALVASKGLRAPVQCECLTQGERPLYITTRASRLLLARHPGTGNLHRTNCAYYSSPAKQSGRGAYELVDVKETDDGTKQVRMTVPLARVTGKPQGEKSEPAGPRPPETDQQGRVTPLGLLNLLWEEGDLHRWHPNAAGKRSWAAVRNALLRAAGNIEAVKSDLADRLIVLPAQRGTGLRSDVEKDLRDKVAWSRAKPGQVRFLLLVGELHEINRGEKACGIKLAHAGTDFPIRLFCSHELADKWATSFPDCARIITNGGGDDRVIALFLAECREREGKFVGDILGGALMAANREFIPFASSYERTVANKLIADGRWFEKPLRYDAGEEWCMPDFVLLDTPWPQLPMEVYGRNNDPAYARRRDEKRALYRSLYGDDRHWEWIVDPAYPEAVPGLPPKRTTN